MSPALKLHILVIEDNAGDFLLINDYLQEAFDRPNVIHAITLSQAKQFIDTTAEISVILLDLALPDASGDKLVKQIVELVDATPIIVLTGYDDKEFGIKSLYLGISDYLLKAELTANNLHKSILYSIERKVINFKLNQSEDNYRKLFDLSPSPQWVYDAETFHFLDVNNAAIEHYGYSRKEFLSMTVKDIRPKKDIALFEKVVKQIHEENLSNDKIWTHLKKDGEAIYVNIRSNAITFNHKKARLTVVVDITNNINTEIALKASEQRFKALVQEGADLITIMDNTGKYLYVSPSTKTIWGLDPELFIGKNVFDFVHKDDIDQIIARFRALGEQKRIEVAPFRFKGRDNQYRWIETVLTDLTDDPAVGGVVSNSKDITHRVQIEKEIAESIQRYDTVSKATSDVIYEWDIENDQVLWNQGLKAIFGHTVSPQTDLNFWPKYVHPDDLEKTRNNVRDRISRNKLKVQGEYRFQCADGSYKYVLDRGFIIYNEVGKATKMIGSMQDITDQMHYIKQMEEQNSKLSEIAWMQSHLVRAPLCNVMSLSTLLECETNENKEIVTKLVTAAKELDDIIRTILKK
jgi:PAS domain S-box-containing protein